MLRVKFKAFITLFTFCELEDRSELKIFIQTLNACVRSTQNLCKDDETVVTKEVPNKQEKCIKMELMPL